MWWLAKMGVTARDQTLTLTWSSRGGLWNKALMEVRYAPGAVEQSGATMSYRRRLLNKVLSYSGGSQYVATHCIRAFWRWVHFPGRDGFGQVKQWYRSLSTDSTVSAFANKLIAPRVHHGWHNVIHHTWNEWILTTTQKILSGWSLWAHNFYTIHQAPTSYHPLASELSLTQSASTKKRIKRFAIYAHNYDGIGLNTTCIKAHLNLVEN